MSKKAVCMAAFFFDSKIKYCQIPDYLIELQCYGKKT